VIAVSEPLLTLGCPLGELLVALGCLLVDSVAARE
jgi:hypothetical protein